MDSINSDILNIIDIHKEVLFHIYLYPTWMSIHQMMLSKKYDTLPDTNNYNAYVVCSFLLTARH